MSSCNKPMMEQQNNQCDGDSNHLCIYHDSKWRSKLQFLSNQLSGKVIPPKLTKRLRIICTCKEDNADYFRGYRDWTFSSMKDVMEERVSNNPSIYDPETQKLQRSPGDVLLEILNSKCRNIKESRWRLLVILQLCNNNDYSIFNESKNVLPEKIWKSKYNFEKTFEVKVAGSHAGCLFGRSGQHIKKICRDNSCEIRIMDPANEGTKSIMYRRRNILTRQSSEKEAVIRGHREEDVEKAKEELLRRIVRVGTKMEKHFRHVETFTAKRAKHQEHVIENRIARMQYWSKYNPYHRLNALRFTKAAAARAYDKRRVAQNKKRLLWIKKKRETKLLGKKPLLVGGHCKHCYMAFTTVKEMHKTRCRFHPGYLVSMPSVQDDIIVEPVENHKILDEISKNGTEFPNDQELADLAEDLERVAMAGTKSKCYGNHRNHHKPSVGKVHKDSTGEGRSKNKLKKETIRQIKKRVTGKAKTKRCSVDSESSDDSYITCSDGYGFESDSSESDSLYCCEEEPIVIDRREDLKKWSCCNKVLCDSANEKNIGKMHYNHFHCGCQYGVHEFVQAQSKKEVSGKRDGRKIRAAGRDGTDLPPYY